MTCELCAQPLDDRHSHVVDMSDRRLLCSCYPCSMLFSAPGAARGRYKMVPRRYARIPSPLFSDAQWEALGIPIGLAFFFESTAANHVIALYPSPAGATESLLPLQAWNELRAREPLVASMEPDVEAALVRRKRDGATHSYIVPIDACYELVGLVRTKWNGIGGGGDLDDAVDEFFARMELSAA